tara:strand:- start:235 stop:492 length:258 start_codon:yes stop_codon:yes gene_type:complete
MTYKILNLLIVLIIIAFLSLTLRYYYSTENINLIKKNRNNYNKLIENKTKNLPTYQDDTNNVIIFNDGYQNIDKEEKRKFWELFN